MSRDDKLISFYKQCVQKGYTNMEDDTQSLKAKVIAMDLKLRYKTIESLFAEAKSTYETRLAAEERARQRKQEEQEKKNQQAIAERNRLATDGEQIMTVYDYLSGEKEGREVTFYRRPDKSIYYKENGGSKKEGQPSFSVESFSTVFYNYHEGKTVYTGATVGGITTGGFHTEAPFMREHKQYTGKGEIIVSYGGKHFEAKRVRFPAIIAERFHRDSAYWSHIRGGDYLLVASSIQDNKTWQSLMQNFERIGQYERLEKFSNAKADTLYSKETCREIVRFLDRIVRGDYPKSDKERFESVSNIPEDASAATLKKVIDELSSISGYSPADALRRTLQPRYECVLQEEKEAEVLRREKVQKKRRIVVPIVIAAAVIAIAALLYVAKSVIPDSKYSNAVALMKNGQYDEAYSIFLSLDNYKDSAKKAELAQDSIVKKEESDRLEKTKESLKGLGVGSYIEFGVYEQDNDLSNGKEAVKWRVLEVANDRALVISEYVLDCQEYNTLSDGYAIWKTATLRKWLNSDFLNAAFSEEEKAMIPTVTVPADKNPYCDVDPGGATQDKVFLLSIVEADRYFSSDSERNCWPTEYAIANGIEVFGFDSSCYWWLRTLGSWSDSYGVAPGIVALVSDGGNIDHSGYSSSNPETGVRPALWIDLNA